MFSPDEVMARPLAVYGMRIPRALRDLDAFDWLSTHDAARAARITRPARRAQFAAGRWLLRHGADQMLGPGRYTVRTLDERPVITCIDGAPAAASISHSGEEVLCALGRVRAIGVDIEQVRPRADWNRLSEWVLHA